MLAAGGGWRASSDEVLKVGVARADSRSGGGGAVDGDARGEVSESDDELPETASRFLLSGEGVPLETRLGEAVRRLALPFLSLRPLPNLAPRKTACLRSSKDKFSRSSRPGVSASTQEGICMQI